MRQFLAPALVLGLVVACGGGNDGDYGDGGGGAGGQAFTDSGGHGDSAKSPDAYSSGDTSEPGDTGSGTTDTGSGTSEGGTSCTSLKCTSDTECQTACGPVSGGIECCDTATQVCFSTASSTCPVSTGSGSDSGMGY